METNLRPLTLGEILDRTAQLYRTNFLLFAGIAALYAGVALVINLVSLVLMEVFKNSRFASPLGWQMQAFGWSSLIVMLIVSNVANAANNRAVAWVHLGEPASIAGAYRSILPHAGRYLGLGTLKLLIAWTPVMLLYGAFEASFIQFQTKGVLPHAGQVPQPKAAPSPETILFGLITIAFLIVIWPVLTYAVIMALRYALAVPASVVENLKVRAAMRRSVALTKAARGRIFVLWLLVLVVEFMVITVTQVFFVVYSVRHHNHVPVGLRIAQQFVGFFTNSFVGPILAIGTTLFYYDQRVRKEGYDIEWMMAAAGLGPSTQAAVPIPNMDAAPAGEPGVPATAVVDAQAMEVAPDALSPGDNA
jgi:hypothetical protein